MEFLKDTNETMQRPESQNVVFTRESEEKYDAIFSDAPIPSERAKCDDRPVEVKATQQAEEKFNDLFNDRDVSSIKTNDFHSKEQFSDIPTKPSECSDEGVPSPPSNRIETDHQKSNIEAGMNSPEKKESAKAEEDNTEACLEQTIDDYVDDLKEKSDCPETIPDKPFNSSDLHKLSPEENAKMREEFDDEKARLKKEWEKENGRPWPQYDHDVYSTNGKLIRKAGSDYDAHHIQPLGMGGKNEASNITPLSAEVHYDKQGVHSPDSPYSKMNQILGGVEE